MVLLTLGCMSGLVACPTNTTPILPVTSVPMVAPTVVSISPANAATGVRADAKIIVTFSQPMDQAATQAAYQSSDLPASSVGFTWDASSTVLTVKPNAPLEYAKGTTISIEPKSYAFTLTGAAKDKSGSPFVTLTSSFTTLREITLSLPSQEKLDGSIVFTDAGHSKIDLLIVGDDFYNFRYRSFLSFDLSGVPNVPSSSNLLRATLRLFKNRREGDPYLNLNPSTCDGTGTVQCDQYTTLNLDHVNYGLSLDQTDFYTPTLAVLGAIDNLYVVVKSYVQADVLSAVRDDLANRTTRENRSQYRLSFPLLTNSDNNNDLIQFANENPVYAPETRPSLLLEYQIP